MCLVAEPVRMSEKAALRVVVTGAAGQIAYSLLYQIASGYVFGEDQVYTTLPLVRLPTSFSTRLPAAMSSERTRYT